jgi:dTDP-glucose 4,6-dehydratase
MPASTALVTGAAGFLGSHLCEALVADGWAVVGLDNLLTGERSNLDDLASEPRFDLVEADVSDYVEIPGALDAVLHLASPASPPGYLAHPIATLKAGALGTHHTLGLARDRGARYLLASTSEVYGDPLISPQPETYWGNVNPIGVRSVYDEAKRFAEAIAMAYLRTHGVDVKIVRIFNTYGPRLRPDDGRVISTFLVQALSGDALTVFGDGTQTRSFCYVSDEVDGILRLLRSDHVGPMNIGNPIELTMIELAKKVLAVTGSTSSIEHQPLREDDPRRRCPDITLARRVLGWEPTVDLEEGVRRTAEWLRGRV